MRAGDLTIIPASPEIQFRKAFLDAQKTFKDAKESGENPFYHSHYSTLRDVWEAAREALSENGFTVHQSMAVDNNHNVLVTKLCHIGGWTESSTCLLPANSDPQKMGSAISYFRRYSLAAILGIVQEDDDGNQASEGKSSTYDLQVNKPSSKASTTSKFTPVGEFRFTFGKYNGKTFNDVPQNDLASYMTWLKDNDAKKNAAIITAYELWVKAHKALSNRDDPPTFQDEDMAWPEDE